LEKNKGTIYVKDDILEKYLFEKGMAAEKKTYICLKNVFLQRSCQLQEIAIGLKKG
jgi:hypothetical protein